MAACRACGEGELAPIVSLGLTPLADRPASVARDGDEDPRFPLDVGFCETCALVQLVETVPQEQLYGAEYLYFSSVSDAVLAHARAHAEHLVAERRLDNSSFVVEVGSNDGYLLRNLVEKGIPVLGIDPAPAQAEVARESGIPTLTEFFGPAVAERLLREGRRADVIVANFVMANTPFVDGFMAAMATLLADDGMITIENAYVRELVERVEFDTISHGHVSYFSCLPVVALARRHGLHVNRVEPLELHGGSLRWTLGRHREPDGSVEQLVAEERSEGLDRLEYYASFGARVEAVRGELVNTLTALRADGKRVAAYGAAAKGATLLNVCGIGRDLVDFVVDRNAHKQGLLMPGVRIPIREPAALLDEMPDAVLMLAWNFADEILEQQAEYRQRGGRFVIPIPQPQIV